MIGLEMLYDEASEVSNLLQARGWSEKNAGNFSVKIEDKIDSQFDIDYPLKSIYKNIADCFFLVTGKGKRMRDIAKSPKLNTVVIKINSTGDAYSTNSENYIEPTSELTTHMAIHNMIAERGSEEKVVMHSHVTELIALSHIEEFCDNDALNNLLWSMHPETIMFIPSGIGFVPFLLPGSAEIADATIEALENHPIALWEKHGVFSIANTLNDSFDLLDIASKSAKIYFMCTQSGNKPAGLSLSQLDEIKKIKF